MHGEMKRAVSLAFYGHVVQVADAAVSCRRRVDSFDQVSALLLALDGNRQIETWKHRAGAPFHVLDERARGLDREHPPGGDARVPDEVWS